MRLPLRRLLASAAVSVVALAGVTALASCGGNDGDDALQQAMAEQFSLRAGLSGDDANCYAGELLDYFGDAEMQRFVDNPESFQPSTPADQAVLLGALERCGIDPGELQDGQGAPAEMELERVDDPSTATSTPG